MNQQQLTNSYEDSIQTILLYSEEIFAIDYIVNEHTTNEEF